MSTSVESTPPSKDDRPDTPPTAQPQASAAPKPAASASRNAPAGRSASPGKSAPPKDTRGLSALDEMNLERTILRRGLATQQEIDACKGLKPKHPDKSLLELMVAANVLTRNQGGRLVKEVGEPSKSLQIPGYEILERLGKGSMGVVYKARQTSVDRIVALKVLLDALAKNKEFIKRFEREAKIAAKLSHAHIVNAIDAGSVNGQPFFVMEFIEGETIKDMLDKGKVFDEMVALEVIVKVAEALKHAHQRGLIHRDIKPENIILTKDRNVKLADLGLARPTADEKWAMAEAGMAIGTPYYISPEQVRGQVDVDIRADIYGLGATLYHMVTGRVPFTGDTPADVMKKHADKNCVLEPPDHVNTRLSSGLGVVVETMMAKNRENRYRNPDDLIIDLKNLLEGRSPVIAEQKSDALAHLAEGEASEDEGRDDHGGRGGASDSEKRQMAAIVNARTNVIAVLAILLAVSVLTNVVMLVAR